MLAVGLLWVGVSNRYMLLPISLFAIFTFAIAPTTEFIGSSIDWGPSLWIYFTVAGICGAGLLTTYFMRFRKVSGRGVIDYLKLSAVTVISSALLIAGLLGSDAYLIIIVLYACAVYYYDRLIQLLSGRSKIYIVALLVQTVLCAMFLIYALVQRTQAMRMRELVDHVQKNAEQNERAAIEQRAITERLLKECQSK